MRGVAKDDTLKQFIINPKVGKTGYTVIKSYSFVFIV